MKKIVIVGAGPAGLTAALELSRKNKDYEIVVLEESDQFGGISRTLKYRGNRMDIGGHRFFSKDERVTKWWNEIMPLQGKPSFDDKKLGRLRQMSEGGPDPEREDNVMLIRQRVSRIFYNKKFFDYPISMKPQTFMNMGLIQTIKAGSSYLVSTISKKQEDSLENFYINRFGRVLYSMFFEGYTEKLWGRHPKEISAEWGAQRVKGLSILAIIKDVFEKILPDKDGRKVETSLIEEFVYPKYGPGQLWEKAAETAEKNGVKIKKNCRVVAIHTQGQIINAVTYINENAVKETMECDCLISTMPIKDLIAGMDDRVPDSIQKIAAGLPYRDFITIGFLFDRINLKNTTKIKTFNNIVPDCWIYVQDVGVKLGRIQIFNNWSPYMVADVEHKVWIGLEYFCKENDAFWNMSDEDSYEFAAKELVKMGIINGKEDVLDAHREKVKKAYPAYFDTYSEMDQMIRYLNQYENLYCIGRNGQHRYNNMDHSMVTAFEAVENIVNHREEKDNIWNVNTEQEYHEEK